MEGSSLSSLKVMEGLFEVVFTATVTIGEPMVIPSLTSSRYTLLVKCGAFESTMSMTTSMLLLRGGFPMSVAMTFSVTVDPS